MRMKGSVGYAPNPLTKKRNQSSYGKGTGEGAKGGSGAAGGKTSRSPSESLNSYH